MTDEKDLRQESLVLYPILDLHIVNNHSRTLYVMLVTFEWVDVWCLVLLLATSPNINSFSMTHKLTQ